MKVLLRASKKYYEILSTPTNILFLYILIFHMISGSHRKYISLNSEIQFKVNIRGRKNITEKKCRGEMNRPSNLHSCKN